MTPALRCPVSVAALVCGGTMALGCNVDLERMLDQKKAEPFEASAVFSDGKAMRVPPAGTVAANRQLGPPELVSGRTREGSYIDRIATVKSVNSDITGSSQIRWPKGRGFSLGAWSPSRTRLPEPGCSRLKTQTRRPPSSPITAL